jgi:hypothetical protein
MAGDSLYGLNSMKAAEVVAKMVGLEVEFGEDMKGSEVKGGGHMIPPNCTPKRALEHLANITQCNKVCGG